MRFDNIDYLHLTAMMCDVRRDNCCLNKFSAFAKTIAMKV